MKKITLLTLLVLLATVSLAYAWKTCQTDHKCVRDCQDKGYRWSYCKSICSWCTDSEF
jgi:hypothetical protein